MRIIIETSLDFAQVVTGIILIITCIVVLIYKICKKIRKNKRASPPVIEAADVPTSQELETKDKSDIKTNKNDIKTNTTKLKQDNGKKLNVPSIYTKKDCNSDSKKSNKNEVVFSHVKTEKDSTFFTKIKSQSVQKRIRADNFIQDNYMMTTSTQRDVDDETAPDLTKVKINNSSNKIGQLNALDVRSQQPYDSENTLRLETNERVNTTIEYANQINEVNFEDLSMSVNSIEKSTHFKDLGNSWEFNNSSQGENMYEIEFSKRNNLEGDVKNDQNEVSKFVFK